jgi:hypothetical protein
MALKGQIPRMKNPGKCQCFFNNVIPFNLVTANVILGKLDTNAAFSAHSPRRL